MSTPGGYITRRNRYEEVKRIRADIPQWPTPEPEELIEGLVGMLITRLYEPCDGHDGCCDWHVSADRLREEKIDGAINWGDLSCSDVGLREDGVYLVTIEEAAPDAQSLCAYVQRWLTAWGWPVEVETEW